MKEETKFRKLVDKFIDSMDPYVYSLSIQQKTIRGCPDKILCIGGQLMALELKATKGKLSPLQKWHLQRIVDSGGMALEVNPDNWDDVKNLLLRLNS